MGDHGQKVWTSLAHWAHWCFVLVPHRPRRAEAPAASRTCSCRCTSPASRSGRSCRSPATRSSTRCSSTARARRATNVVGEVDGGWRVAMGTLAFERGASTLGQQLAFEHELHDITALARARRARVDDPVLRQRLADAWIALARHAVQRAAHAARRSSTATVTPATVDPQAVLGVASTARSASSRSTCCGPAGSARRRPDDATAQRLFLYSRADTIYGGSNQIQRNVIGERALGLPKEPKMTTRAGAARLPGRARPARRARRARHRGRGHRHRLRDREALRGGRRARRRSATSTSAGSRESAERARRAPRVAARNVTSEDDVQRCFADARRRARPTSTCS